MAVKHIEQSVSQSAMRWKKFADEYLTNGFDAKGAARAAGYSEDSINNGIAKYLLTKPEIQRMIRAAQAKTAEKYAITRDFIFEGLEDAFLIAKEQRNPGAMVKSMAEIAKVAGLVVEKREDTVKWSWSELLKDGTPPETVTEADQEFLK